MRAALNLEEVESMDANDNNLEITNEGNASITNEQISFKGLDGPIMYRCDEGKKLDEEVNTTIFNECYEVLEEKNRTKETHQ